MAETLTYNRTDEYIKGFKEKTLPTLFRSLTQEFQKIDLTKITDGNRAEARQKFESAMDSVFSAYKELLFYFDKHGLSKKEVSELMPYNGEMLLKVVSSELYDPHMKETIMAKYSNAEWEKLANNIVKSGDEKRKPLTFDDIEYAGSTLESLKPKKLIERVSSWNLQYSFFNMINEILTNKMTEVTKAWTNATKANFKSEQKLDAKRQGLIKEAENIAYIYKTIFSYFATHGMTKEEIGKFLPDYKNFDEFLKDKINKSLLFNSMSDSLKKILINDLSIEKTLESIKSAPSPLELELQRKKEKFIEAERKKLESFNSQVETFKSDFDKLSGSRRDKKENRETLLKEANLIVRNYEKIFKAFSAQGITEEEINSLLPKYEEFDEFLKEGINNSPLFKILDNKTKQDLISKLSVEERLKNIKFEGPLKIDDNTKRRTAEIRALEKLGIQELLKVDPKDFYSKFIEKLDTMEKLSRGIESEVENAERKQEEVRPQEAAETTGQGPGITPRENGIGGPPQATQQENQGGDPSSDQPIDPFRPSTGESTGTQNQEGQSSIQGQGQGGAGAQNQAQSPSAQDQNQNQAQNQAAQGQNQSAAGDPVKEYENAPAQQTTKKRRGFFGKLLKYLTMGAVIGALLALTVITLLTPGSYLGFILAGVTILATASAGAIVANDIKAAREEKAREAKEREERIKAYDKGKEDAQKQAEQGKDAKEEKKNEEQKEKEQKEQTEIPQHEEKKGEELERIRKLEQGIEDLKKEYENQKEKNIEDVKTIKATINELSTELKDLASRDYLKPEDRAQITKAATQLNAITDELESVKKEVIANQSKTEGELEGLKTEVSTNKGNTNERFNELEARVSTNQDSANQKFDDVGIAVADISIMAANAEKKSKEALGKADEALEESDDAKTLADAAKKESKEAEEIARNAEIIAAGTATDLKGLEERQEELTERQDTIEKQQEALKGMVTEAILTSVKGILEDIKTLRGEISRVGTTEAEEREKLKQELLGRMGASVEELQVTLTRLIETEFVQIKGDLNKFIENNPTIKKLSSGVDKALEELKVKKEDLKDVLEDIKDLEKKLKEIEEELARVKKPGGKGGKGTETVINVGIVNSPVSTETLVEVTKAGVVVLTGVQGENLELVTPESGDGKGGPDGEGKG